MSFEIPKTRSEKILQNILGAKNEIEPIQSRIEAILLAILNDTEIGEPYTAPARCEIEKLLVAIKDGGEYNETPLTRSGRILLCKLRGEDYTGITQSRLEKLFLRWLYELMEITDVPPFTFKSKGNNLIDYDIYGAEDGVGDNEDATVSGNPISISDAVEAPAESLKVTFTPTQSGTPWIDSEPTTEPYLSKVIPRGNREYYSLVGGTVAWNQMVQTTDFVSVAYGGITGTNNGDGTYTVNGRATDLFDVYRNYELTANHVYFAMGCPQGGDPYTYRLAFASKTDKGSGLIYKSEYGGNETLAIRISNGTEVNNLVFRPQLIDLTLLFANNPAIADYAYSLEQSEAGSGIAWLKSYGFFSKDYYPYNPGELISVKTSGHKTVGFNQWDEISETGTIGSDDGFNVPNSNYVRSKNYNKCLPNTRYCCCKPANVWFGIFWCDINKNYIGYNSYQAAAVQIITSPSNAYYFRVSIRENPYNNNICVNISDPQKDGTCEPYSSTTYPLSDTELRGLFKLDVNKKLYAEGDIYPPSGNVERNYGIVDLGTLEWRLYDTSVTNINTFYPAINIPNLKPGGNNAVCGKYICKLWELLHSRTDKSIEIHPTLPRPYISDSSFNNATDFGVAMDGVYLVYELATPTTESATPYTSPVDVEAGGTEEFIDNRTVPVPVGNETYYAAEYAVEGKTGVTVNHSATSTDTPTTYTVTLAPVGDNIIPYDLDYIKSINNSSGEWDGNTYIADGISYAFQPDGSVILNGTATGGSGVWYWMASVDPIVTLHIPEGYILSGVSGGSLYTYSLDVDARRCYEPEVLSERDTVAISIDVVGRTTLNNLRIKPSITPPVYGGTVDIVSGVFSVNYGYVDLGSLVWRRYKFGEVYCFFTNVPDRVPSPNGQKCYCSKYNKVTAIIGVAYLSNKGMAINTNQTYIYIRDDSYTDENSFKASLNGTTLVYELATPQTYTLTPEQVTMLLGSNYLETEDGTITLTYKDSNIVLPFSVSCGADVNSYEVPLTDKLYKVSAYADSVSYDDQTVKREIIVEKLDGSEEWILSDGVFITTLTTRARTTAVLCNELTTEQCYISDDLTTLNVTGVPQTSVEEFVTWLQAGDVCVQYVREQTLVVSHQIPEVSTFNGTNTFSVDTEVTPSEVTIIYPNKVTTRTLPKTKKVGTSKLMKSK